MWRLAAVLLALLTACSDDSAPEADASLDAQEPDASSPDAPLPDAAEPDAAEPDATPDAPLPDAAIDVVVLPDAAPVTVFETGFEGMCPAGWTLMGDWQCGAPAVVGPATAFEGSFCIGTGIASNYSNDQAWTGATATSPDIDLAGAAAPVTLTFALWVDTEGEGHDGANLKVSSDGGMTYSLMTAVVPAYPLTVGGEPAWGGHQADLGWQTVTADLSAYAGQTIRLRFAFSSDSASTFAGAYVDDVAIQGQP
jgi:hypothetical protein